MNWPGNSNQDDIDLNNLRQYLNNEYRNGNLNVYDSTQFLRVLNSLDTDTLVDWLNSNGIYPTNGNGNSNSGNNGNRFFNNGRWNSGNFGPRNTNSFGNNNFGSNTFGNNFGNSGNQPFPEIIFGGSNNP